MSTDFITKDIWPQLAKAVRGSRLRCSVAVAYFGKGASRLLPLPKGSHLVVDASELTVKAGQTCPADLVRLVKRGVRVYSMPNLHAKVFVLGRAAFVGSANVSSRSASRLIEAVVRTTDPGAVRAAKRFVHHLCLHELTPTVLKRLAKLYRPPLVPRGTRGKRAAKDADRRPTLPKLWLVQIHPEEWSERDQTMHDEAEIEAKNLRQHPRSFELESFRCTGNCQYRRGDIVIQVEEEGGSDSLVTPPGNVLYVRTRRDGRRQVSFVYLERPARRRRSLKALARRLGPGALKRLRRGGMIRDAAFAQALLRAWAT